MKFFGGKHTNDVTVVHVYDIGSASVGAAIVVVRPDVRPLIVYATRKDMSFQEAPDATRFQSTLFSSISAVAEDLQKNGMPALHAVLPGAGRPQSILCTVASPWYVSQTRRIHKEFKRPTRVRDADIRGRAEEEYKAFVTSPAVTALGGGDHVLIEQRIIQIKLNGYETADPDGKEVSTLDMTIVFSVTGASIAHGIIDAIEHSFPDCHVEFNTFSVASFDAIRSRTETNGDALCIDVSGEVTEVSLVDDGVLLESVSFPIGKQTILRDIAKTLGGTNDEALSLIRLNHEQGVAGQDTERVRGALTKATTGWSAALEQTVLTLGETTPLPSTVYLMSDPDAESWLRDIIGTQGVEHSSAHVGMFSVVPVNALFLNDTCEVSRDTVRDSFLMLEAVFAGHLIFSKTTHPQ